MPWIGMDQMGCKYLDNECKAESVNDVQVFSYPINIRNEYPVVSFYHFSIYDQLCRFVHNFVHLVQFCSQFCNFLQFCTQFCPFYIVHLVDFVWNVLLLYRFDRFVQFSMLYKYMYIYIKSSFGPILSILSNLNYSTVQLWFYRCGRNNRDTERFYSKIAAFERPFQRNLSYAMKARPTSKDAQFCQVHFSHRPFFHVRSRSLLISSFLRSGRKMFKNST